MNYVIPVLGLLMVCLALYFSVAECKRVLVASRGDLKALRQYAMAWMVAFAILLGAALLLKLPALYLALGGLVLVVWITMPVAAYMAWRIRTDGPMGAGRKPRR
jgi:hypothetical protein